MIKCEKKKSFIHPTVVRGSKGEAGERGYKGEPGFKGEKGDKGDSGLDGIPGINGIQGPQGNKGEPGKGIHLVTSTYSMAYNNRPTLAAPARLLTILPAAAPRWN